MYIRVGSLFPSDTSKITFERRLKQYLPEEMISCSRDYCLKVLACPNFMDIKKVFCKVGLSFYLAYAEWFSNQLKNSSIDYDRIVYNAYQFYSKVHTIPARVLHPYLPNLAQLQGLHQTRDIQDANYVVSFLRFELSQSENFFLHLAYQYFDEFVDEVKDCVYLKEIIDQESKKLKLYLDHYFELYLRKYYQKENLLVEREIKGCRKK
ncbi:MAG: hypothetical protein PUB18_04815 [bacterium]|nr:hypothetical protein [bacterium]